PGQSLRRQPRAESARMLRPLDRAQHLDGHRLLRWRIAPRHVEPRWGAFHRYRRAILARQVGTPPGDVAEAHGVVHRGLPFAGHHAASRADGGISTGLMQLSRLLTKMS